MPPKKRARSARFGDISADDGSRVGQETLTGDDAFAAAADAVAGVRGKQSVCDSAGSFSSFGLAGG